MILRDKCITCCKAADWPALSQLHINHHSWWSMTPERSLIKMTQQQADDGEGEVRKSTKRESAAFPPLVATDMKLKPWVYRWTWRWPDMLSLRSQLVVFSYTLARCLVDKTRYVQHKKVSASLTDRRCDSTWRRRRQTLNLKFAAPADCSHHYRASFVWDNIVLGVKQKVPSLLCINTHVVS